MDPRIARSALDNFLNNQAPSAYHIAPAASATLVRTKVDFSTIVDTPASGVAVLQYPYAGDAVPFFPYAINIGTEIGRAHV